MASMSNAAWLPILCENMVVHETIWYESYRTQSICIPGINKLQYTVKHCSKTEDGTLYLKHNFVSFSFPMTLLYDFAIHCDVLTMKL